MMQRWLQEKQRPGIIRRFERKRGSRLITMIHRQEALSFLGIQFTRHIDIEDSEPVLRADRRSNTSPFHVSPDSPDASAKIPECQEETERWQRRVS